MRRVLATGAAILAMTGMAVAQTAAPNPNRSHRAPPKPPAAQQMQPVNPESWGPIGATGSDAIWFMQINEMLSKGDRFRQVWVKIDRSEEKASKYRESHVLYALDCDKHGIQYLTWIDIDRNGTIATNDVVPLKPDGYQPVRPVTMSQAVENSACGRRAWWYGPGLPDLSELGAG